MDWSAVTQRVWGLAEPVVMAAGLELVDVQYRPEGGRAILRLLIDRPTEGVTIDELARISRELGNVFDAHDAVPGRYHLECSSPGLNRPLVRADHYRRAVGRRVYVRTRTPVGGRRQFRGVLEAASDDTVTVADPDVGTVSLAITDVERANIEYDFTRPAVAPAHA
ncbi:MAG: ribosome maturation factor RimP [Candidatus Binatia bacterium]